jgi:hypothetical protein
MTTLVRIGAHHGGRPCGLAPVSMKTPRHIGQRRAPERRPSGCMTVPSFGHFHAVTFSSVMTLPPSGTVADTGAGTQPTQRTSGSFRATGGGTVVG